VTTPKIPAESLLLESLAKHSGRKFTAGIFKMVTCHKKFLNLRQDSGMDQRFGNDKNGLIQALHLVKAGGAEREVEAG